MFESREKGVQREQLGGLRLAGSPGSDSGTHSPRELRSRVRV